MTAAVRAGIHLVSFLACLIALPAAAADAPLTQATSPVPSDDAAAYERLKTLSGAWRGRLEEPDKGTPIEVVYEVASGGKAVIERMFAGTEHEMITVYYLASGRLQATHYCSIGNQPAYRLGSFREGTWVFEFDGGSGFDPRVDQHAHGTTLRLIEPDRLETSWSFYKGEQPNGTARSLLTRARG